MKTLTTIAIAILSLGTCAVGHPRAEHLKEVYKVRGDALFVPLYWLPETRQTVLKHLPNHQNWVGFEAEYLREIKEEDKLRLLEELGAEFERMDEVRLHATWQRMWDWERIRSQLSLLAEFLGQEEGFLDLAYSDSTLRPAFRWILDKRKPDFDPRYIGSSFSSGELASFYPHLIQHLLNTPEKERLQCFSRLFAQIAASKPTP